MPKIILKVTPALIFWGVVILVILKVPYPESLTQANFGQLSLFFIPLFLALTLTSNILFKNILISLFFSLCLMLLLILKALDSLNLITGALISISGGLLFSYFKKSKRNLTPTQSGLTKSSKIPKLTKLQ